VNALMTPDEIRQRDLRRFLVIMATKAGAS
jgi:hypothetical protein